jgi:hypothetical protein
VETVTHTQKFCPVKKRALQKVDRVYGAVCPFCGIELPSRKGAVFVEVGDDGNAIRSRAVPLKPFWKRNSTIVGSFHGSSTRHYTHPDSHADTHGKPIGK